MIKFNSRKAANTDTAKPSADVLILLEGTYPYVRGGVSSWVHQIILGAPKLKFALIFIGGDRDHYGDMSYEMPDNVIHLEEHFLQDSWQMPNAKTCPGNKAAFGRCEKMHDVFHDPDAVMPEELIVDMLNMINEPEAGITHHDFLYSEASWEYLTEAYEKHCSDPSFLNYFWTVRSMHAPIFMLSNVARTAPFAPVIHSISTGYAGLLGAFIKHQRPESSYILSEHGIYTKERKIDLAQADWIHDSKSDMDSGLTDDIGYIRKLWIRFFEEVGRITYHAADPIISLYEGNRLRQLQDGAEESRTLVIPNGISLQHYEGALEKRAKHIPPIVGLIGRIVPIKDIKTFIRAMRSICNQIPEAEGWLVGPTEEDEAYVKECEGLVASMGLQDNVKFLGFQKVPEILPQLGVMVLTSISEAQPLVTLEAYAAGVPCVATDVGSCRELIEGYSEDDKALGHAGATVSIADPIATATECVRLLTDEEAWKTAQQAGLARVQQFYTEDLMYERYRGLYDQALERYEARVQEKSAPEVKAAEQTA